MDQLVAHPEFVVFAATLCAIAVFHRHALACAIAGLLATVVLKLLVLGVPAGASWLAALVGHEWNTWANIMLVLLGFAVLASHFELSGLADLLPRWLPRNWSGGIALLGVVFVLSSFLDNIAGAVIGGIMARHYYGIPLRTGYLAGIVAAANAGGAGSVLGDTTTTMMWISGISPLAVLVAFIPALVTFAIVAPVAAWVQVRGATLPLRSVAAGAVPVDWRRAGVVALLLATLIAVNTIGSVAVPEIYSRGPWLGIGLWIAIGLTALRVRPDWASLVHAGQGALFLVALVALAGMMPVDSLPDPSWQTAVGLGFLSAVFDNIPLTALAIRQGGYDWGFLAYTVGFGGSMMWFGSSAGVALSNLHPEEMRSTLRWVREGWFMPLAYVAGCAVMLLAVGWNPGR